MFWGQPGATLPLFMTISRRRFLRQATPLGLLPLLPACAGEGELTGSGVAELEPGTAFQHGTASGDPLADAVILWTRVTAPDGNVESLDVEWRVASDAELKNVVAQGRAVADPERDYCVKVDVGGLAPASTYYYEFAALGARSGVGRTKTLPLGAVERARLAAVSCANYPAGYFSVYGLLAARDDLDLVLHLGDYLYEYANGTYGDGTAIGRLPVPDRELLSLDDYRARHAQYKTDPQLQALHRQHPVVAIWDDHEIANDGYREGAGNHQPAQDGDWNARKQSAMRAYFEWMPIRDSAGTEPRVYRQFAFGDLFDLVALDTRYAGRDAPLARGCDRAALLDPARSLLGAAQEQWLFDALRASRQRGARWRLLAQQVMLAQLTDPSQGCAAEPDQWDGYGASRDRLLALLRTEAIDNLVVLTGDAHSSWAFDLSPNPFDPALYDPATGAGSLAVELVAPSVTSPYDFGASASTATHPHLKFVDLVRHGYVLIDVSAESARAEWYFASSIRSPSADEELGAAFEVRAGENHWRALMPGAPAAPSAR